MEGVASNAIVQKLSGGSSRRTSSQVVSRGAYRVGDTILCRHTAPGGKMQVAWYNPRTQEIRWNQPEPANRVFKVYESTAGMAALPARAPLKAAAAAAPAAAAK